MQPGTQAPDFTLAAPDGTHHSLSSMRGSYVVLDFWASWCPDCRKDIPAMKQLHAEYGQTVRFVSVSFDDKRDNWTACINSNGMDWLHLSELKSGNRPTSRACTTSSGYPQCTSSTARDR